MGAKRSTLLLVAVILLQARTGDGIHPRATAAEYPAHETSNGVTVAAAAISPDQVRKLFATDLNKAGYLVFEVGIYPDQGKTVDLDSSDFMLKIGDDTATIRAANPQAIAAVSHQKSTPAPRSGHAVDVYPTAEVGYESGGYDPATGRRRSGVYTGVGVGVGVGGTAGGQDPNAPPPPGAADRDQWAMQRELEVKALPASGKVSQPVAGYLYFPKPNSKKRNAMYQLDWYSDAVKVRVPVPPPAK